MSEGDLSEPLSPEIRPAFERCVVGLFQEPADEDYINARILWRYGRYRGFAWLAAQSIEKYIKSALLLNWKTAKFGHDFHKHITAIREIAGELIPDFIEVPQPSEIPDWANWPKKIRFKEVIERFQRNGDPKGRYRETQLETEGYDIHLFDAACFLLRRLSVDLDSRKDAGTTWREYLLRKRRATFELHEFEDAIKRNGEYSNAEEHIRAWNYQFSNAPPKPDGFHFLSYKAEGTLSLRSLNSFEYSVIQNLFLERSKVRLPDRAN